MFCGSKINVQLSLNWNPYVRAVFKYFIEATLKTLFLALKCDQYSLKTIKKNLIILKIILKIENIYLLFGLYASHTLALESKNDRFFSFPFIFNRNFPGFNRDGQDLISGITMEFKISSRFTKQGVFHLLILSDVILFEFAKKTD